MRTEQEMSNGPLDFEETVCKVNNLQTTKERRAKSEQIGTMYFAAVALFNMSTRKKERKRERIHVSNDAFLLPLCVSSFSLFSLLPKLFAIQSHLYARTRCKFRSKFCRFWVDFISQIVLGDLKFSIFFSHLVDLSLLYLFFLPRIN